MVEIRLKRFDKDDLEAIWTIGFSADEPEWTKWNGPYFEDYQRIESAELFSQSEEWNFLKLDNCRCIVVDGSPIGMVSRNWESKKTRWMEIGIVIYDENYWHSGIGRIALSQWITQTFRDYPELEHLGMTTWSGNQRMMRVAEKLGWQKEAQIRKVRYWKGVYYDSVKYGVLRTEWESFLEQSE